MSMRKRGTRVISVDHVDYQYKVRSPRDVGLVLTIQRVEPAGQILRAAFELPVEWTDLGSGSRIGFEWPVAVTPRIIREIIETGLARGWQPAKSGLPPLRLDHVERVPALALAIAEARDRGAGAAGPGRGTSGS